MSTGAQPNENTTTTVSHGPTRITVGSYGEAVSTFATWFTSLGFNNSLMVILLCAVIGVPIWLVRFEVPTHLKLIQEGTKDAAINAAKIGDNRIEQQGILYERMIKEQRTSHEGIMKSVQDSYKADQERDSRLLERIMHLQEETEKHLDGKRPNGNADIGGSGP